MNFCRKNDPPEKIREKVAEFRREARPVGELAGMVRAARETGDDEIANLVVSGALEGFDFSGLNFNRMVFVDCDLQNCDFSRASFMDALWGDSNLSNARFDHGFFSGCCLLAVKGVGADFTAGRLTGVRIAACNFQYGNFSRCRCHKLRIEQSDLSEAVFSESILQEADFSESRFNRTTFFRTPLAGIDLTSCEINGLGLSDSAAELRRAVVSPAQAVELAKLLGVVVK